MVRQRVRLHFAKSGTLKFIGHNDLLRSLESLFRRAELPLAMSNGFHPKIKMSSPSALALGMEGFDEVLDLEFDESAAPVDPTGLLADLNRCSINGLTFLTARILNEGEKKARLASSVYEAEIPREFSETVVGTLSSFLKQHSVTVEKSNGKPVDVRKAIIAAIFFPETGILTVEIAAQTGPEAGIREVLTVLGLEQEHFKTVFPKRIRCNVV